MFKSVMLLILSQLPASNLRKSLIAHSINHPSTCTTEIGSESLIFSVRTLLSAECSAPKRNGRGQMPKKPATNNKSALHLVKLSVGSESVEGLEEWQALRRAEREAAGEDTRPRHVTRMTPKRGDELLAGGSIYWVIKRNIVARQKIVALEPVVGEDGISRCAIILDPTLVRTEHRPKRPFQGWRYLTAADAPSDLTEEGEALAEMPGEMREALASFGVR